MLMCGMGDTVRMASWTENGYQREYKKQFGAQIAYGLAQNDNHIIYSSHPKWESPGKAREVVRQDLKDAARGKLLAKSKIAYFRHR